MLPKWCTIRTSILFTLIICSIISCKSTKKKFSNCTVPYTLEMLFKDRDSSKLVILQDDTATYIWDKMDDTTNANERGRYLFDKNHILRQYAYLLKNDTTHFMINYDSIGNEMNKPDMDVVRWFIGESGKDSLELSFMLFQINRSYGKMKIFSKDFSKKASLFDMNNESKMCGGGVIISNHEKIMYITGKMRNDCSGDTTIISDSVYIPKELVK